MFPQYSLEKCTTSPSPSCQTAWRFSGTGSSSTVNLKRSRERSRELIFCSFGKKIQRNCYILSKCRKYLICHISHINIYTHYILTSYTCPYFFKENPRNSQKIIHLILRDYSGSMQTKRRCETCHFHGNFFRWSITHTGTCSCSPKHFRSRVIKIHSKFSGLLFSPSWTLKTPSPAFIKKPPLHRCYVSLVANRAALVWVSETALSRQGASNLFLENSSTKSLWEIEKRYCFQFIIYIQVENQNLVDWGSIV